MFFLFICLFVQEKKKSVKESQMQSSDEEGGAGSGLVEVNVSLGMHDSHTEQNPSTNHNTPKKARVSSYCTTEGEMSRSEVDEEGEEGGLGGRGVSLNTREGKFKKKKKTKVRGRLTLFSMFVVIFGTL